MTAVSLHRPRRRTASSMNANEPEDALLGNDLLLGSDNEKGEKVKTRKKRKKDKRRKRYSSSSDSCSSEYRREKRKRSKRKRHDEDDSDRGAGSRINPIFLWVKEADSKIVEVMCEDYDKRNRIKLTKTANGWISVPHTQSEWSKPTDNQPVDAPEESEKLRAGENDDDRVTAENDELPSSDQVDECLPDEEAYESQISVPEIPVPPQPESNKTPDFLTSAKPCCSDLPISANLDENHNNEMNPSAILSNPLAGHDNNDLSRHLLDTCVPDVDVDSFCNDDHDCVVKGIIDELESSINSSDDNSYETSPDSTAKPEPIEFSQHSLMEELEEMCHDIMNEELKAEKPVDVKEGNVELFSFGPGDFPPTSASSKAPNDNPRSSHQEPSLADITNTEQANLSPKNSPINLVVDSKAKPKEDACLTENDLETLDILWRLPEGTTIHQSKNEIPSKCKQSESPSPLPTKPLGDVSILPRLDPVQEEPLNLGKPKDHKSHKIDIRPDKFFFKKDVLTPDPMKISKSRAKSADDLPPEIHVEPLTQLKELMADPDMSVPDPLLVPKARLPALIANPKLEIPRLMALNNEIKYSKLEADLLEVSLAHLQLLVQSGSKDDLKSQKNQDRHNSGFDPATMNALNQMLWLPYLTQLDVPRQNNAQDLLGMMNMMYPYNWSQKTFDCLPPQQPLPSWEDILHRPPEFMNAAFPNQRLYGDTQKKLSSQSSQRNRDSTRLQSTHRRNRYLQPPTCAYPSPGLQDYCRLPSKNQSLMSPTIHPQTQPEMWPVHGQRGRPTSQPPDFYNRVSPASGSQIPTAPPPLTWGSSVGPTMTNQLPPPAPSALPTTPLNASNDLPKLKVRKFEVDPNSIPKLLNLDRKYIPSDSTVPHYPSPGSQHQYPMYNGNHLWHPLYARSEEKKPEYVSPWNWTIPVTISGK